MCRKWSITIIAIVSILCLPTYARNILSNGSFERVTTRDDGTVLPSGWQENSSHIGNATVDVVEDAWKGKRALHISTAVGKGRFHIFTSTLYPVRAETKIDLRFGTKGKGNFLLWIYCYSRSGGWVGGNLQGPATAVDSPEAWTENKLSFTIPEKPFKSGVVETIRLAIDVDKNSELSFDGMEMNMDIPRTAADDATDAAASNPILAMPPIVYGTPGIELNLYFDDVLLALNPANVAVDVQCSKGTQFVEKWAFTPGADDVGEFPLQISVYDQTDQLVATGDTAVSIDAPDAPAAFNVLMIGDSLTHASAYPEQLLEDCSKDEQLQVTLVGTHAPRGDDSPIRHEGYGGWTAERFVTLFGEGKDDSGRPLCSPFVFEGADGKPGLDYAKFIESIDGVEPDVVTIFLGPNDIFGADEAGKSAVVEKSLSNFDHLIKMIQDHSPKTQIGLLLPAPPAATQDAFGYNYGCTQTRWQYRRNQHHMVLTMLKKYGDKEDEGIFLLPTHAVVDALNGYPARTVKVNSHSDATITRLCNGVHPSAVGYKQISDAVYCWLKHLTTLQGDK